MDVYKAISKRKSIRNFLNKKISKDILEDILNNGILAPSSKNKQPWRFYIVENKIKEKISQIILDYAKNDAKIRGTAIAIDTAPVLILVMKNKDEEFLIADTVSIGACVENICLRATELHIGSLCICDVLDVKNEILELLSEEELEIICGIALGYYDEIPNNKSRKKLEEVVKWIKD